MYKHIEKQCFKSDFGGCGKIKKWPILFFKTTYKLINNIILKIITV